MGGTLRWLCCLLFWVAAGCGAPSLLITPVANTNRLVEMEVQPGRGWFPKKVAVIEVEGMLTNARAGGLLQPGENKVSLFKQQLDQAASDDAVRAVVLRINSPGGTVTASDTMYQLVRRFKERTGKPVIASTQEVAASGGYYVACAADKIVAHPTSVVGSIGVIYNSFDLSGTMNKLGVRNEAIKSGRFKDLASPLRQLRSDEREVLQAIIDEHYARFTEVVTTNRPIDEPERLVLVTDGRVFTGDRALELGLVDATGLLEDAIDLGRQLADVPGAKVVLYKRPFGYGGSIYASAAAPQPQANVVQFNLADVQSIRPGGFYYLWEP